MAKVYEIYIVLNKEEYALYLQAAFATGSYSAVSFFCSRTVLKLVDSQMIPSKLEKYAPFLNIANSSYGFPQKLVYLEDGRLLGYSACYCSGKPLDCQDYTASFTTTKKHCQRFLKDTDQLSKQDILIDDLAFSNVLYSKQKGFFCPDTDAFKIGVDKPYTINNFRVCQFFSRLVQSTLHICPECPLAEGERYIVMPASYSKLVDNITNQYLAGSIDTSDYIDHLQKQLEEIAARPLTSFAQARKVLLKSVDC